MYLDDIIIFSRTAEEHERHVKTVLQVLNSVGMILNLEKCKFFQPEVRFLGHIISKDGSRPDPRRINKILEWPTPRNITELRGFNSLASGYSQYVDWFAEALRPLTDLQKGASAKQSAIAWGDKEEEAFQEVKRLLTSEPILMHPQLGKPFYVDPDASQFVIGAQLLQYFTDDDGVERLHPIAYESKKLTDTEQRYSAQERELLAAKYALDHWRHIIEGSEIIIRSDHESLKTYRTKKLMTKRLTRFMNDIEHYDPLFTWRSEKMQQAADALSRMPGAREEGVPADTPRFFAIEPSTENKAEVQVNGSERHRMKKLEHFHMLQSYLKGKSVADDVLKEVQNDAKGYALKDGELWSLTLNTSVILTAEELKAVIKATHEDLGHYGRRPTLDAVRKHYDVARELWKAGKKVLRLCVPCQLYKKVSNAMDTATIHPYGIRKPFSLWQLDFAGKFITTPRGNRYVITAIEYTTSRAIAWPIKNRSADIAVKLLDDILWTYGKPEEVFTDNGSEFILEEFMAALKRYGIKPKHTSPGHPQTNGKVERWNLELVERLQRISAEKGNKLED